ncbi:DnaJ (Hsp40), sub C, member 2 [Chamberlinius hualienensis]
MVTTSKDTFKVEVYEKLTEFAEIQVEPVGSRYLEFCLTQCQPSTVSSSVACSDSEADDSVESEIEDDIVFLRSLDPKDWKNQDHYAVLGLKKFRNAASNDLLKKAYRKKVLLHHPDKRKSRGEKVLDADSDYFTCITKAYEILGNPTKRCSYDSVDPEFDDFIPPVNSHSKENFFEVFPDVFRRNARWSTKSAVPELGVKDSSFEEVNKFYNFWYNFDSWREFSYLDEEEKERGENREERRWIEKQNKAARLKRKKEEMVRIRQLVDNGYACDPRVQRFKEEERLRKVAQKQAKQEALRAKAMEEERKRQAALESDRKAKEKEETEMRIQAEAAKKAKETMKKSLKKQKKQLQTTCKKFNYFAQDENEVVHHLTELDKLCELLSLENIIQLNKEFDKCDAISGREIFLKQVQELNDKLNKEKEALFNSCIKSSSSSENKSNGQKWSPDDVQLLIKAVNLFPAGTSQRWEVVASYINQHSANSGISTKTAKDVLTKAKSMQKSDFVAKEEVTKLAYQNFEKKQKLPSNNDIATPTQRFDTPAELQAVNTKPWTGEEQRLLEQAIKTYPNTTPNRWDSIASCIPSRNKDECMQRFKELVEMVKAKKAAKTGVTSTKSS